MLSEIGQLEKDKYHVIHSYVDSREQTEQRKWGQTHRRRAGRQLVGAGG